MLRNTDRAEFPLERSISQTLKFKRKMVALLNYDRVPA